MSSPRFGMAEPQSGQRPSRGRVRSGAERMEVGRREPTACDTGWGSSLDSTVGPFEYKHQPTVVKVKLLSSGPKEPEIGGQRTAVGRSSARLFRSSGRGKKVAAAGADGRLGWRRQSSVGEERTVDPRTHPSVSPGNRRTASSCPVTLDMKRGGRRRSRSTGSSEPGMAVGRLSRRRLRRRSGVGRGGGCGAGREGDCGGVLRQAWPRRHPPGRDPTRRCRGRSSLGPNVTGTATLWVGTRDTSTAGSMKGLVGARLVFSLS